MVKCSFLVYLVDTGHHVGLNNAFKVIYHITWNLTHGLRVRLLRIAEAVGIRVHKLDLDPMEVFTSTHATLAIGLVFS